MGRSLSHKLGKFSILLLPIKNTEDCKLALKKIKELHFNTVADTKDKLKIVTQKFATTRKERDQFKTDNKELQDEIIQLQQSMR